MESMQTSGSRQAVRSVATGFMQQVYLWMCAGLLITAASAYLTASVPQLIAFIFGNSFGMIVLCVAVILMPMAVSAAAYKLSPAIASCCFVVYSMLVGALFSSLLLIYTGESLVGTFAITAGMFGVMSAYGMLTRRDLTGMKDFMVMGLIGLLIAMIVNLFLQNSMMQFCISAIAVIVFAGLTAYDTQRLIQLSQGVPAHDGTIVRCGALLCALTLYLDFINIFIHMVQLFGERR